jgi:hypothetical protein
VNAQVTWLWNLLIAPVLFGLIGAAVSTDLLNGPALLKVSPRHNQGQLTSR